LVLASIRGRYSETCDIPEDGHVRPKHVARITRTKEWNDSLAVITPPLKKYENCINETGKK
jgi:hypothetical protein